MIAYLPGVCQRQVEHKVPFGLHLLGDDVEVSAGCFGLGQDQPFHPLEALVHLSEALVNLVEALVDLLEALVDLLETVVEAVASAAGNGSGRLSDRPLGVPASSE